MEKAEIIRRVKQIRDEEFDGTMWVLANDLVLDLENEEREKDEV